MNHQSHSYIRSLILLSLFFLGLPLCHAGIADSVDFKVRAGYNIGATAPLDLPPAIRSLDAFRPTLSLMLGADASVALNRTWGLSAGLHLENKGMDAEITVKGYHMEMKKGTQEIDGLFSGHVKQEVSAWMLTLPLLVTCHVGEAVTLKAGPYFSLLLSKKFSGIASDGHLRQGDPTGPKIEIGSVEGEWATYDFSNQMRTLQWGISLGIDWQILSRMGLSADLSWGLSGLFGSDFKTVEQTLYPIYGTVGLFYRL